MKAGDLFSVLGQVRPGKDNSFSSVSLCSPKQTGTGVHIYIYISYSFIIRMFWFVCSSLWFLTIKREFSLTTAACAGVKLWVLVKKTIKYYRHYINEVQMN